MEKIDTGKNRVQRHSLSVRLQHWANFAAWVVCIWSGWLILNTNRSSMNPEYTKAVEYHYFGVYAFLFIAAYHLFFHWLSGDRQILPKNFVGELKATLEFIKVELGLSHEWPSLEKYAPNQKFTYLAVVGIALLMVITGGIKALGRVFELPSGFLYFITLLHDLGLYIIVLFLIVHVLLVVVRFREMLVSMFTGYVSIEYVKKKHATWWRQLTSEP